MKLIQLSYDYRDWRQVSCTVLSHQMMRLFSCSDRLLCFFTSDMSGAGALPAERAVRLGSRAQVRPSGGPVEQTDLGLR